MWERRADRFLCYRDETPRELDVVLYATAHVPIGERHALNCDRPCGFVVCRRQAYRVMARNLPRNHCFLQPSDRLSNRHRRSMRTLRPGVISITLPLLPTRAENVHSAGDAAYNPGPQHR